MFEDLGRVIEYLQIQYNDICNQWKQINGDNLINLKRKLVIDIRKNQEILNMIWEYRTILNDEILQIMFSLENIICKNSTVDSRVKAQNSIEYKIENYICNHENGRIPIKKCLNDLLGARIVIDGEFCFNDVKRYVEENYPGYKCIDSSKNIYKATHIYFENGNQFFPWELQIWNMNDEKTNYKSHKEYKQGYTKWENESKGGNQDG